MSEDDGASPAYNLGVFINCPFDPAYRPMFDAIVFAVMACGHVARSALEFDDAGRTRFTKITDLIGQCRFGIHDLSRTDLSAPGGLPRFNMSLELGLFLGAVHFGATPQGRKQCLILDSERTRYRDFASDLAGHDIKAHGNDPARTITAVRDFLRTASGMRLPGGAAVAADHGRFTEAVPDILRRARITPEEMTFADTTTMIFDWLTLREPRAGA